MYVSAALRRAAPGASEGAERSTAAAAVGGGCSQGRAEDCRDGAQGGDGRRGCARGGAGGGSSSLSTAGAGEPCATSTRLASPRLASPRLASPTPVTTLARSFDRACPAFASPCPLL